MARKAAVKASEPAAAIMRRQYLEIKRRYPQHLCLIRCGDFYEAFDADAQTIAKATGITVNAVTINGVRLANVGIPYHAIDKYRDELISMSYKVGIADPTSV